MQILQRSTILNTRLLPDRKLSQTNDLVHDKIKNYVLILLTLEIEQSFFCYIGSK